jgi:probable HAF family extracellular repeat protein
VRQGWPICACDVVCLSSGGIFTTINDPGSTFGTYSRGINNTGQIVGEFQERDGNHGFVATPTAAPEPASMALLGTGILGLFVTPRRAR